MLKNSDITRLVHTRNGVALFSILAIVATLYAYFNANVVLPLGDKGFGIPSAVQWLPVGALSMMASLSLNLLIIFLMMLLNKTFNLLRSITPVHAAVFMILQMAIPDFMCTLYDGTIMTVVVLLCSILLFSTYCDADNTPRVFLIFFSLTLCAFTQYAYLPLLPVFFIGCIQMRIMQWRTFLAAGIGVIAPIWLLFGFGIITTDDLAMPRIASVFVSLDIYEAIYMIVTAALTVLLCISMWVLNLMRVIGFNMQTRAYNGFFALLSLAVIVLILVDYGNFEVYVPLLNCCTAFQVAHFVTVRRSKYGYLWLVGLLVIYATLYLWGVWMF